MLRYVVITEKLSKTTETVFGLLWDHACVVQSLLIITYCIYSFPCLLDQL